jgi:energy-coupling factor transporter ATP-binding protein EcfA2
MKAIGPRLELALAPLTLLVGPNAVGKSTILEAIALMAQSARPPMRIGLMAEGATRLTDIGGGVRGLHHGGRDDVPLRIELSWKPADDDPIGCWFEVAHNSVVAPGDWAQGLQCGASTIRFEKRPISPSSHQVFGVMSGGPAGQANVGGSLERFLDEGLFVTGQSVPDEVVRGLALWKLYADRIADFFASPSLRYISALRGGPLMSPEAKGTATTAGRHGEHTIRLLSALELRGQRERKQWMRTLAHRFGLPELAAGYAGDEAVEATYEDPHAAFRLGVGSAGFGSQQALPILTDLATLPAGGTLLVEEIEHSSHPAWISEWGTTVAEAAGKMGVQIVATTHAPDLVLSAARAVKKGVLPPESLAVHELTRGAQGIEAKRWQVDAQGRFEDGWIDTFASAERRLLGDLLSDDGA